MELKRTILSAQTELQRRLDLLIKNKKASMPSKTVEINDMNFSSHAHMKKKHPEEFEVHQREKQSKLYKQRRLEGV